MTDVEMLIREQLSGLDPLPPTLSANWEDVLSRVRRPVSAGRERLRARPRRLAFAVVVAAIGFTVASLATPLGAAISRGLGDFSAWISGSPGTPASPEDQQAFEQENERDWTYFPAGTQLRQLIQTETAGMTFKLFGFRSGDSLCLRLVVDGRQSRGTGSSCAPVAALEQAREPALVIETDDGFGSVGKPSPNGYSPSLASATFGISSDGVKDVILSTDDGVGHALIGSNAFLYVADHPSLGMRVRSVKAIAADGSSVVLPFSRAPFGSEDRVLDTPTGRPIAGPIGIERQVKDGTISWLVRREKRGEPLSPEVKRYSGVSTQFLTVVFAREIQPDPASLTKMVIALAKDKGTAPLPPSGYVPTPGRSEVCYGHYPVSGGATFSCSPLSDFFADSPVSYSTGFMNGGDQFANLDGVVSDDVQALDLYLADGTIQDVAIKDNVFATSVARGLFPARIVTRDEQGAIIGNRVIQNP
ncbi:MAG: hypothetical protein WBQ14_03580 [Gaiellaceae bacterium]